jgi:hypothetical protein
MLWLYDIPTWLLGVLVIGGIMLLAILGLFATRRLIERIMGPAPGHNEGVDAYIATVSVFYGLVAGLIVVAVWEQYSRVDEQVTREASAIASLYRIAESYPDPQRAKFTGALRTYTRYIIDEAWPAQKRGVVLIDPANRLSKIQEAMDSFQPKTPREQIIFSSAVSEFDAMYELRRLRLHNVGAGLLPPLWLAVLLGAALTIFLSYFMALERFRVHVAMTAFIATMVALLIFMIVVVDRPFRGEVSIGPDAFELVYKQLMARESRL